MSREHVKIGTVTYHRNKLNKEVFFIFDKLVYELEISFFLKVPEAIPKSDVFVPILWIKDRNDKKISSFMYQHERGTVKHHRAYFETGLAHSSWRTPEKRNIWEPGETRHVSLNFSALDDDNYEGYLNYTSDGHKEEGEFIIDKKDFENPAPIKYLYFGQDVYVGGYAPMFNRGWEIDNLSLEMTYEEIPNISTKSIIQLTELELSRLMEHGHVTVAVQITKSEDS